MHLATYLSTLGVSYDADLAALALDVGDGRLAFPVARLREGTVWLTGALLGSCPLLKHLLVRKERDGLFVLGAEPDAAPWPIMGFDPRLRAALVLDWCWRVGRQGDAEELDALLRLAYERSGLAPGYLAFRIEGLPGGLEILDSNWAGRILGRPTAYFRARLGGLAGSYWSGRFDLERAHVQQYPEDEPFRDALILAQGHDPRTMMRIEGERNRLAALMLAAFDPRVADAYDAIEVS